MHNVFNGLVQRPLLWAVTGLVADRMYHYLSLLFGGLINTLMEDGRNDSDHRNCYSLTKKLTKSIHFIQLQAGGGLRGACRLFCHPQAEDVRSSTRTQGSEIHLEL